ncbi:MAG: hypothetical protein A2096_14655 [Spirochaetes bacterium GWF1_41_5]|nr:MAG: hypothetical protein A2096_14655 [Spirochaetes bacterium GWF1_41_5]
MLLVPACVLYAESVKPGRLKIITTLFPLYDFSRQIGQDRVNVVLLLPPGVEPHSWEPTPKDIVNISTADVFIYTSRQMEVWAEKILTGINKKNPLIVEAGRGIDSEVKNINQEHRHHPADPLPDKEHTHEYDPHIWVDPLLASLLARAIFTSLSQTDPPSSDFYRKNAELLFKKFNELDLQIKQSLSGCRQHTLVFGGHFAFGHFVKRYNLEFIPAYRGFSPNSEPSARQLAYLIKTVKEKNIKYIYYEELLSPKLAYMLSKETGCALLLLHAAHNVGREEIKKNITYFDIMTGNIENLKKGLECGNN